MKLRHAVALTFLIGVALGSIIGGVIRILSFLVLSWIGQWPHHFRTLLIFVPGLLGGSIGLLWELAHALREWSLGHPRNT